MLARTLDIKLLPTSNVRIYIFKSFQRNRLLTYMQHGPYSNMLQEIIHTTCHSNTEPDNILTFPYTLCLYVSKKLHPFYFCHIFVRFYPIPLIFGRNILQGI